MIHKQIHIMVCRSLSTKEHDWTVSNSILFGNLSRKMLTGIMMAHINVPALDATPKQAATLSKKIVTDLLKTEMGFKGLVFTDAMNMKGVTSGHDLGEPELMAYLAGNDIIEFSLNISASIAKIEDALKGRKPYHRSN